MPKLSRRQLLSGAALTGAALLGPFSRVLSKEDAASPVLSGVFRAERRSDSTGRAGDLVYLSAQPSFSWPAGSTVRFGNVTVPADECTPFGSHLLFRVPGHIAGDVSVTGTGAGATSNPARFRYLPSDVAASTGFYKGYGNLRVTDPNLAHQVHFGLGYIGFESGRDLLKGGVPWGAEYRFWQSGGTMVWQTAMLPASAPGVSLQAGVDGAYDSHWVDLAHGIMTSVPETTYFSIGWEYSNADWFSWGVNSLAEARNYAKYYRRIVDLMRSTLARGDTDLKANVDFKFGWNFNRGPSRIPNLIETSYPGDAWVDVVGFDLYDSDWRFARHPDGTWADPQTMWNHVLSERYSLEWLSNFAIAHGKALGFPEWALVGLRPPSALGAGDDPSFIIAFNDWLARQPRLAYNCYFDFDPLTTDGTQHSLQNFPKSSSVFRDAF